MDGEPFVPLFQGHVAAGAIGALTSALKSGQLATGPRVGDFEQQLGEFVGNPNCVATSDRAAALTLALRLCGVEAGTEVMLSPLACLATTMPVANLGATPVWCDVDPATGMLDPTQLAARRSARTRAILHYHWAGDVGPLAELQQVAGALGLPLVEDASGAFGAELDGHKLGATGSAYTVYSFYAVSHLASGDGGALFCATAADADRARQLRRFGIDPRTFRLASGDLNPASDIPAAGYSFAMTDLTAALALAQLADAPLVLAAHRSNGLAFDRALSGHPHLVLLERAPEARSAYWVYALRSPRRDALLARLHAAGIGAQRLHVRNDGYGCFGGTPAKLPGVAAFDAENLCVPSGWWVDLESRVRIIRCLKRAR